MGENYYIYCVIPEEKDPLGFQIKGHDNGDVFVICYSNICAVVSRTLKTSYEPTLTNLQCHENVILEVMKKYTALPLSFSTISKSKLDIVELLKKYYCQFKANLMRIAGKVELGVKVFYKLDFEKEDKADKINCKNGKEYMKIRYDRYLNRKKQTDSILTDLDKIHDILKLLSCETYSSNPLKNNLVFNGAYLVNSERVKEFFNVIREEEKKYPTYKIIYSGPWSPYHFVRIIKEGETDERY